MGRPFTEQPPGSNEPSTPNSNPNPNHTRIRTSLNQSRELPIKLTATSNDNPCSPAGDFLRQLSVSSVLLMGLCLSSLWAFSSPALDRISAASSSSEVNTQETVDNFEDEDMKAAFERWKSKSYALTVPLRIVALEGSVPPVWIREFLRSQGKRVRFHPEFRRSCYYW